MLIMEILKCKAFVNNFAASKFKCHISVANKNPLKIFDYHPGDISSLQCILSVKHIFTDRLIIGIKINSNKFDIYQQTENSSRSYNIHHLL